MWEGVYAYAYHAGWIVWVWLSTWSLDMDATWKRKRTSSQKGGAYDKDIMSQRWRHKGGGPRRVGL